MFGFFLAYITTRPPLSVHKKFQPNRSSRFVGYREQIYECLVLLYRFANYTQSFVTFFNKYFPKLSPIKI